MKQNFKNLKRRLRDAWAVLAHGAKVVHKRTEIPAITTEEIEEVKAFFPMDKFFIYGHSRSGNTLLMRLVRLHPEVHANYQGVFFSRPPGLKAFVNSLEIEEWLKRPQVHGWLFFAFDVEGELLSLMSWLGLILLMFISGFEIERSLSREDMVAILVLVAGSTIIPFIAGWLAPSIYDFTPYLGDKNNLHALQLVIAIATAITSIPVISKIFMDLGIMDTLFARVVLAIATIHDVLLWVALAVATGLVGAETPTGWSITLTVVLTIIFFLLSLFVIPRVVKILIRSRYNFLLRSSPLGYVLVVCFLFAAVASFLNINVVFGALLAGVVVGMMPRKFLFVAKTSIKEVSLALFIPLYFAIVGLKLDFIHSFKPLFFLWFLAFTTFFQFIGTMLSARLIRRDWLSSINLSVAMSTRGGPGIVLATVAFNAGIINESFFLTLVLIAITTSLFAGVWFRYVLNRGWQLLNTAS